MDIRNITPEMAKAELQRRYAARAELKKSSYVDTFLGRMPTNVPEFKIGSVENKNLINEMINTMVGEPGIKLAGEGIEMVKPFIQKGFNKAIDYMSPGKEAERFRSTLGRGTSKKNISDLSVRAQIAKRISQEDALIPKNKLYEQEGGSDIYKINPGSLPEGNIDKFSEMIAPGEKYGEPEAKALSKALEQYRMGKMNSKGEWITKPGEFSHFQDTIEDIFNIPELSEKSAEKIEDIVSLPTSRSSKYFSDKEVTNPYSSRGKLKEFHDNYKENPTLSNYDNLQSALKKELRKMEGVAKVSDTAIPKVEQLQANISNLNQDKEEFMQTLPQNMQNLENEFRNKYRQYAEIWEKSKKETGSSLTLRRLAEGHHDLIDDNDIVSLFSHPTKADQKAILDMGEGAARNAIYAALQRVETGDAEGMAKTLLDLKHTKGFDKIITKDMQNWANNMIKQNKRVALIKKSIGTIGGAAIGGLMGGGVGATFGAALPWGKEFGKVLASKFRK